MEKSLQNKIIKILMPVVKTIGKSIKPGEIDVLTLGDMVLIKPSDRPELKGILKGKFKKPSVKLVRELRRENDKR